MANTVNVFDFQNESLAQFLAKAVSDGTYADVVQALKVDQSGEEAAATQIATAAGQLWSNMADDFVIAAYPLLASLADGTVPSSRLVETPNPTFGSSGFPPTFTYTLAGDERVAFNDSGLPIGASLEITLPAISGLQPGQEVSLRLPFGNPTAPVSIIPDAADTVVDPATGQDVGPPGSTLSFPAATFSTGVTLTWQMVGTTPSGRWAFEYDNAGGGAGGGDFATTLAAGPDSGANDAYMELDQAVVYGTDVATEPNPEQWTAPQRFHGYEASKTFLLAGGGGEGAGTYVSTGFDIFSYASLTSVSGCLVTVEWEVFRSAFNGTTIALRGSSTGKQRWSLTPGGAAPVLLSSVYNDSDLFSGNAIVQIGAGSSNGALEFEILDSPNALGPIGIVASVVYRISAVTGVALA